MKYWKFTKNEKLPLVACCQDLCGYIPNLNMANCYVYCKYSYPTFRFGMYPQAKKWADTGSYTRVYCPQESLNHGSYEIYRHETASQTCYSLFSVTRTSNAKLIDLFIDRPKSGRRLAINSHRSSRKKKENLSQTWSNAALWECYSSTWTSISIEWRLFW